MAKNPLILPSPLRFGESPGLTCEWPKSGGRRQNQKIYDFAGIFSGSCRISAKNHPMSHPNIYRDELEWKSVTLEYLKIKNGARGDCRWAGNCRWGVCQTLPTPPRWERAVDLSRLLKTCKQGKQTGKPNRVFRRTPKNTLKITVWRERNRHSAHQRTEETCTRW